MDKVHPLLVIESANEGDNGLIHFPAGSSRSRNSFLLKALSSKVADGISFGECSGQFPDSTPHSQCH